jgi:hypothetical protein
MPPALWDGIEPEGKQHKKAPVFLRYRRFFAYFCSKIRNFTEKQEKRIDFPEIFTIIKAVSMIEAQMP